MPTSTYTAITSHTISTSVNSYTFSSISAAYTDLRLIVDLRSSIDANIYIRLNGDSTAGSYKGIVAGVTGVTPTYSTYNNSGSNGLTDITYTGANYASGGNIFVLDFFEYTNTNKYKLVSCDMIMANTTNGTKDHSTMLWKSTAAISSMELFSGGPNFSSGTVFTLYGIKAAS